MKPYFYVYRHGDNGPRVRHATLKQAEDEAARLAEITPGTQFEILMAMAVVQTSKASTFWMDGVTSLHRAMDETCLVCGKAP